MWILIWLLFWLTSIFEPKWHQLLCGPDLSFLRWLAPSFPTFFPSLSFCGSESSSLCMCDSDTLSPFDPISDISDFTFGFLFSNNENARKNRHTVSISIPIWIETTRKLIVAFNMLVLLENFDIYCSTVSGFLCVLVFDVSYIKTTLSNACAHWTLNNNNNNQKKRANSLHKHQKKLRKKDMKFNKCNMWFMVNCIFKVGNELMFNVH